nr:MAG TPA: hypothetical protein [Caudoviricetes sp.]
MYICDANTLDLCTLDVYTNTYFNIQFFMYTNYYCRLVGN